MQRKKIISGLALALAAVGAFWQTACKHEYIEDINPVCFETEIQPLIASNCTQSGCHNAIDKEKGRDYTTYAGILRDVEAGDFRKSELFEVLLKPQNDEEAMPPKPYNSLTEDQILLVARWIEQGAAETKNCASATACDTAAVTFSASVKPILQTYCIGCHSGSSPSGDIDYSTHAGVKKDADNGKLVGSVEWASGFVAMPDNGSKLSNCQIATIKKWVAAGAPNN